MHAIIKYCCNVKTEQKHFENNSFFLQLIDNTRGENPRRIYVGFSPQESYLVGVSSMFMFFIIH